jgi:hypothetical protein
MSAGERGEGSQGTLSVVLQKKDKMLTSAALDCSRRPPLVEEALLLSWLQLIQSSTPYCMLQTGAQPSYSQPIPGHVFGLEGLHDTRWLLTLLASGRSPRPF